VPEKTKTKMNNNLISRNLEEAQNEVQFDRLNINFAKNLKQ